MPKAISTCSIVLEDGTKCDGITGVPGTARGWCSKHYNRWQKHGDPLHKTRIMGDDIARYESKVDRRGDDECWPWTGGVNADGYGAFSYRENGETIRLGEPLGPGEESCHSCDNPICQNYVSHLRVDSHAGNMADMSERGRAGGSKVTHCPKGRPYDEENTLYVNGGKRRCRICNRASGHKSQVSKTHCVNGHELAGENLLIVKNGKRKCATCEGKRAAETAERMTRIWAERRAARESA